MTATDKIEPSLPSASPALPGIAALIPLLAIVALIAGCFYFVKKYREANAPIPRSVFVWVAPQFALLVLATVSCFLQAAGTSPVVFVVVCLITLVCGILTLYVHLPHAPKAEPEDSSANNTKNSSSKQSSAKASPINLRALGIDMLAIIGAAALAFMAIDLPWSEWLFPTNPLSIAIQAAVLIGAMVIMLSLCQGHGGGMAVLVLICAIIGMVQYFTAQFRGQALLPGDILAAPTAAAVSTGYRYVFTNNCMIALACASLAFFICSFARPVLRGGKSWMRVLGRLAVSALIVALGVQGYTSVNLRLDYDIVMDYWNNSRLLLSYCEQGFIPTFLSGMQSMPIEKPEGYSAEDAERIEAEAASAYDEAASQDQNRKAAEEQFEAIQPNVVVVMNESFADLSTFEDLWAGYEGPTYFNSGLTGTAQRGNLTVSVNGGGTCNSEFEFLTGNSCAFIGYGKHPYATYDLEGVPNMAQDFSDIGYATTAIHPNLASNWNRETVYEQFGFDQFIDITGFEGAETLHSGVTDAATYEKVIDVLEQSDQPQFIFDVTMQNHSGYDQNNISADQLTTYHSDALDDEGNRQMNEYLSCIQASDEDLEYLVSMLSELDEPTVLVFFGDHQPYLTDWFNHNIYGGDTDEILHQQRMFHTAYVVWANYDIAGNEQNDMQSNMSLNYLGASVKQIIGAPLTERDKANLTYFSKVPALNPFGYQTPDGAWYDLEGGPEVEVIDDMAKVQYLRFATYVQ